MNVELPRASLSLHRFIFIPQCTLVPSPPQVNGTHIASHLHDIKENGFHQAKQSSSIAPKTCFDVCVPTIGAVYGGQGFLWAVLCWVHNSTDPCAVGSDALCVVTYSFLPH